MASYSQNNRQRGSALVIILTIAVVLLTGGALAYVGINQLNKEGKGIDVPLVGQKTITATTPETVKGLLTKAQAGEYDAKCTFTDDAGNQGTLYVEGEKKMRVDTTISDKPGHVLRLDDKVYIWADGQDEGSLFPMREDKANSNYSAEKFADNVEKYKVTCKSVGSLDSSLFALPKGVNFVDVNEQLKSFDRE